MRRDARKPSWASPPGRRRPTTAGATAAPANQNRTRRLGPRRSSGSLTATSTRAMTPLRLPCATQPRGCGTLCPGPGPLRCVSPRGCRHSARSTLLPACTAGVGSVGAPRGPAPALEAAGRRQGPERHRSPGGCTPPSTSGPPTPSSLQVEGTVTPTLQRHPSGTPGRSGLKWTRRPISSSQGKTWPGRGGRGSGQDGLSGHKCPDAPDGWGLGRGC